MSYLLRRLEFFAITLWAALTVNFLLPRLMPGSPAEAMLVRFHGRVSPQTVKAMEIALGVHSDQNIVQQYFEYLGNTFTGNLGVSLTFFPTSKYVRVTGSSSSGSGSRPSSRIQYATIHATAADITGPSASPNCCE